jgi:hypothetical protein
VARQAFCATSARTAIAFSSVGASELVKFRRMVDPASRKALVIEIGCERLWTMALQQAVAIHFSK